MTFAQTKCTEGNGGPLRCAILLLAASLFVGVDATAQAGSKTQDPAAAAGESVGQEPAGVKPTIGDVGNAIQKRLQDSLAELSALRAQIGDERVPMAEQLAGLEAELAKKRETYDQVDKDLAERTQDLSNAQSKVEDLRAQSNYLGNLLNQYSNEFQARLHIAELQRYQEVINKSNLVREDTTKGDGDKFAVQIEMVNASLDKIDDAIGGTRFEGNAVANGVLTPGKFVLVGPTALFASADTKSIGMAEEREGQEPTILPYSQPEDRDAAASLAIGTGGSFPMDVTLGNAQKVESIEESWWEHVQKGGPIMIPMAVLAGAALLVVLLKWISMMFVRRPSKKQMALLIDRVDQGDFAGAKECAVEMQGPAGRMLEAGANHLGEPRDLVEEVMFEQMLSSRLKLQGWLPFVAICATSAPLLGLLGTVTGIMGTFALMTEFGTGDPKVLSSGISEALITTEHGLIVAIPSLLLHAFLSRKSRSLLDSMEKMALQFLNHLRSDPANVTEPSNQRESAGVA